MSQNAVKSGVGVIFVVIVLIFGVGVLAGVGLKETHEEKVGTRGRYCFRNRTCDRGLVPVTVEEICRCALPGGVTFGSSLPDGGQ